MITRYTSDCYLGPRTEFLFRTLLVAHGYVGVDRYVFAEFVDEEDVPPGMVPEEFQARAEVAFRRAESKRRAEGGQ